MHSPLHIQFTTHWYDSQAELLEILINVFDVVSSTEDVAFLDLLRNIQYSLSSTSTTCMSASIIYTSTSTTCISTSITYTSTSTIRAILL
jgi:hypothetical protein